MSSEPGAGHFDLLSSLLLLQQLLERIFVMIFELFRRKVAGFGFDDVYGQLQYVVAGLFIDLVEADFVYSIQTSYAAYVEPTISHAQRVQPHFV